MRTLIALLLALSAAPAFANPPCLPHDQMASTLRTEFGETAQSHGMTQQGQMMQVYANHETGSWSIALTDRNGITCLVLAGGQHTFVKAGDPA